MAPEEQHSVTSDWYMHNQSLHICPERMSISYEKLEVVGGKISFLNMEGLAWLFRCLCGRGFPSVTEQESPFSLCDFQSVRIFLSSLLRWRGGWGIHFRPP